MTAQQLGSPTVEPTCLQAAESDPDAYDEDDGDDGDKDGSSDVEVTEEIVGADIPVPTSAAAATQMSIQIEDSQPLFDPTVPQSKEDLDPPPPPQPPSEAPQATASAGVGPPEGPAVQVESKGPLAGLKCVKDLC